MATDRAADYSDLAAVRSLDAMLGMVVAALVIVVVLIQFVVIVVVAIACRFQE